MRERIEIDGKASSGALSRGENLFLSLLACEMDNEMTVGVLPVSESGSERKEGRGGEGVGVEGTL